MPTYNIRSNSGTVSLGGHDITTTKESLVDLPCLYVSCYSELWEKVNDGELIIDDGGVDMSNGVPVMSRCITLDEGTEIDDRDWETR